MKWPAGVLTDRRVTHYWDESRAVGVAHLSRLPAMLAQRAAATLTPSADAMWDALYLYTRDDRWEDPVPLPAVWGYPIMVTREELLAHIADRLGR